MIWYKHWLELRYRALAVLLLPLLSAAFFTFMLFSPDMREQNAARIAREWPRFADLLPAMGTERLLVWIAHVLSSGFVSLFAAIAIAGGGIGTGQVKGGLPASIYFTLSLPTTRLSWVWTRFASGFAVVAAVNLLLLIIHSALVLATGHVAPWSAMALSSAYALLSALPFLAVFQPLLLRGLAMPLILLSLVWAPAYTDQAAAGQPILWLYITVGVVGFALTCWSVPRRDF